MTLYMRVKPDGSPDSCAICGGKVLWDDVREVVWCEGKGYLCASQRCTHANLEVFKKVKKAKP